MFFQKKRPKISKKIGDFICIVKEKMTLICKKMTIMNMFINANAQVYRHHTFPYSLCMTFVKIK